jgi:hypothetical protein
VALVATAPAHAQSVVRSAGPIAPGRIADARHAPPVTALELGARPRFLPPNLPNPIVSAHRLPGPPALPSDPVAAAIPPPSLSFDGINTAITTGLAGVPDTNGDVGENHFVQIVNWAYAVWDKSGNQVLAPVSEAFAWRNQPDSDDCKTNDQGDPIVLYDPLSKRWLLSFFAFPRDEQGNYSPPFSFCVAVSTTSDPTGSWCPYTIPMAGITGDDLPDYPKYGVWPDGYYVTVNAFSATGDNYAAYIAFDRTRMLNCQPWRAVYFLPDERNHGGLPADLDGPAPPIGRPGVFLQASSTHYALLLYRLGPNYADAQASLLEGPFTIPIPSYDDSVCDAFDCIPQPGTTVKLDGLDRDKLMHRLPYRNFGAFESLLANQTVAAGTGKAAVRWYEIRAPFGTPLLYQSGDWVAGGSESRWLGSIAQDKFGNIAVGYNVSGPSTFPSLRYAGRVPTDPLGTLGQGEATLVAGGGSKTALAPTPDGGRGRWGDYGLLTVDPVDDCTFWFTGEYLKENVNAFDWWTRIGTFRMPGCGNQPPVALFTWSPQTPVVSQQVVFDSTASYDPDGTIVARAWDFDGDGRNDSTATTPTVLYTSAGTYPVRLTVTDDDGATDTLVQPVTVVGTTSTTLPCECLPPCDDGDECNGTETRDTTTGACVAGTPFPGATYGCSACLLRRGLDDARCGIFTLPTSVRTRFDKAGALDARQAQLPLQSAKSKRLERRRVGLLKKSIKRAQHARRKDDIGQECLDALLCKIGRLVCRSCADPCPVRNGRVACPP